MIRVSLGGSEKPRPSAWAFFMRGGYEPAEAVGIGVVQAAIKAARDRPLPKNGEVGNGRSFDNVKATKGGNDTDYTLRRLYRDKPELLDRIESGELSVNAAAIKAARERPLAEEACLKAFKKAENRLDTLKRPPAPRTLRGQ